MAIETLGQLYQPYDYLSKLNSNETAAPFDPGGETTTTNVGPKLPFGQQAQTTTTQPLRNPDYFTGKINDLLNPAVINRGQTLGDLFGERAGVFGSSAQNYSEISSQAFGARSPSETNLLNEVALNGLGRLQLMSRLEDKFGPGWRDNPMAQSVTKSFENLLTQQTDLTSLYQMIESGKRVEDYLSSQQNLSPGNSNTRISVNI